MYLKKKTSVNPAALILKVLAQQLLSTTLPVGCHLEKVSFYAEVMALFDVCGVDSRSNFKQNDEEEQEREANYGGPLENHLQLALPPMSRVSLKS